MEKNLNLDSIKEKITHIINEYNIYYENNVQKWDDENKIIAHEMLGTLIIIYKKIESIEYVLNNTEILKEINLDEIIILEVEEIKTIIEFYYKVFIEKKGL